MEYLLRSTVMVVFKQQFRRLFAGFCVKSAVLAGYPALYGAAYHVSLLRAMWHVHVVLHQSNITPHHHRRRRELPAPFCQAHRQIWMLLTSSNICKLPSFRSALETNRLSDRSLQTFIPICMNEPISWTSRLSEAARLSPGIY